MTVEIVSPIYDNVDIRSWAKSIREIKIRELTEVIATLQKEYDGIKDINYSNATTDLYMHFRKTTILTDLLRLNLKLDILKK